MTFRFSQLPVALTVSRAFDQVIVETAAGITKRASIELIIPTVGFTMNNQTGTTYTVQYNLITDDLTNAIVTMNNASANTVTIPQYHATNFPVAIGAVLLVRQIGAGATTVAAGSGVTINTPGTNQCRVQYAMICYVMEALNIWRGSGDYL